MDQYAQDWLRSETYHDSFLIGQDKVLEENLANSAKNGLPDIAVTASQGKLLMLIAQSIGAKNILEVGTLGGYSTTWLARALPKNGKVITCELKEEHAKVAKANLDNAGVADRVEIVVGPAAESLAKMQPSVPFDLVFIDADKPGNLTYFKEAKRLTRKGAVIIVDNVVRQGKVANPDIVDDANVAGVRALLEYVKDDAEVDATAIATVGGKGWDGFMYTIRK